jgi:hypothetical protein
VHVAACISCCVIRPDPIDDSHASARMTMQQHADKCDCMYMSERGISKIGRIQSDKKGVYASVWSLIRVGVMLKGIYLARGSAKPR